jgi:NAD+ kinase
MRKNIQRVGLIGNPHKPRCRAVARLAAQMIMHTGRSIIADVATAQAAGLRCPAVSDAAEVARRSDLILALGGDGTMLGAARAAASSQTPLLGINLGGLGFLSATNARNLPQALKAIWSGQVRLETRVLMEARGRCDGRAIRELALNDFVISRGLASRLISLEVQVDDRVLTRYRCDGLIVSTPTGSTAYSLSAGGAVVFPDAEVLAITPICPHTLSNRSVIVSLDSVVRVKILSSRPETILSADGQGLGVIASGDALTLRRAREEVRFLQLLDNSFASTLQRKLKWSGSNY